MKYFTFLKLILYKGLGLLDLGVGTWAFGVGNVEFGLGM